MRASDCTAACAPEWQLADLVRRVHEEPGMRTLAAAKMIARDARHRKRQPVHEIVRLPDAIGLATASARGSASATRGR